MQEREKSSRRKRKGEDARLEEGKREREREIKIGMTKDKARKLCGLYNFKDNSNKSCERAK